VLVHGPYPLGEEFPLGLVLGGIFTFYLKDKCLPVYQPDERIRSELPDHSPELIAGIPQMNVDLVVRNLAHLS
jgi:hypothetical protein